MLTVREKYPELYKFLDNATEEEKAEFFGEYALHLQERLGVSTKEQDEWACPTCGVKVGESHTCSEYKTIS